MVPHLVPHEIILLYNGIYSPIYVIMIMAKRITDTSIKALVIKDKEYTYTVEEGLQLRIRPKRSTSGKGTKAWQFK
ncbi:hypothetical protein M892_23505 [Vibrio campbellii ATCC BAA-1116]|nr:hypothetical protein M892_23505 [Vibrio campbellii ATCC BAA-1116]